MGRGMMRWVLAGLLAGSANSALAASADHVATITRFYGRVKILINPSPEVKGPGPHVLFEELYYQVVKPKRGMKLQAQNVVQTGPRSRLRLIYENGDQISVDGDTFYRIQLKGEGSGKVQTNMKLFFGAVRATVQKGGPREDLKVRTRTMNMGVRGTDFFVRSGGGGATTVTVLRGRVAVRPAKAPPSARAVEVPSGFSTSLAGARPEGEPAAPLQVRKTSKAALIAVQQSSQVKAAPAEGVADAATRDRIATLEKAAVQATLKDIRREDPALYQKLTKDGPPADVDAIQTATVRKAWKAAPKSPKVKKPGADDLDLDDDEVYDRYFK